MNNGFVSGFGKVNVDLIFQNLPRLPHLGEEVFTPDFSLCLGGGIPATLLNVGRLGVPAKIVTQLGGDMFSAFAAGEFKKAGAQPVSIYDGDDVPINLTCVMLTPGERTFVSYGKELLSGDMLDRAYRELHGARVIGMQLDSLEMYKKLHDEGSLLVLDTGYVEDMSCEKYEQYLKTADYYTPNRAEALKITGCDNIRDAAVRLHEYFDDVIIKLDRDGCLIYNKDGFKTVKSIDEFRHCDSTGAGDAFLAGFMYGLYHAYSIESCVLFGNLTGGKCVTAVGCTAASLTEPELLSLAKKYRENILPDKI